LVLKLAHVIATGAILLTLGSRGFFVYQQGRNAASGQQQDSLVEIARRNKAEGKNKTAISEIRIDYGGANMELDQALINYSIVIAEPVQNKSFALDSSNITTWYKFRVLETLARKSYIFCSTCSPVPPIPEEMGEPNYDEFFVDTIGGVLNVEGVEISQPNSSLHFETGNKYMMFVNLSPSQVAVIAGGPSGVFELGKNGSLRSLNKENARLPAEMQRHFGRKLSEFRSHFNR
jgi:hypothetical protein